MPRHAHASLNYGVPPTHEKPFQWINEPPAGVLKTNVGQAEHPWEIRDLRDHSTPVGLDRTGFEDIKFKSKTTYHTFDNDDEVKRVYYPEIVDLLKMHTGGHRVAIFDHTIRKAPPDGVEVPDTPSSRQPVSRVHVDQTPDSAVARVRRHLGDDAEKLLEGRVRLINVWKPLRGPVKDIPLAVADFNSLDVSTDLLSSDLIYSPEQIGQTFLVKHNPRHRFFYKSDMQPDDALLLKCFDSASLATPDGVKPGIAALTPHTAFVDLDVSKTYKGPKRESIEVRALVFG